MVALALLLISGTVQAHMTPMHARADGTVPWRLVVGRTPTKVVVAPHGPDIQPTVEAFQTGHDLVYGTINVTASGAYIQSLDTAFVKDRRRTIAVRDCYAAGAHNNAILIVPNQYGPWEVCSQGFVYLRGRLRSIGLTTKAHFAKDGSVEGWYWVDEKGKPFRLIITEAEHLWRQNFTWKNGRRRLGKAELVDVSKLGG
jgi:hypothetical protein